MPSKSESRDQPTTAPDGEATPAAGRGRKSARKDAAKEAASNSAPAPAEEPTTGSGGAEAGAAPAPAEREPEASAPTALAGLRGEGYVKALKGHPLATLEVPLLPQERRGDWERARGQKIPVTARQFNSGPAHWLDRDHTLAALVIELQRPGAARFDQIDLRGSSIKETIERLSDYTNQARLRAQAQTGKKWTASQVYLIPVEDA